jgi:hypothetical protein
MVECFDLCVLDSSDSILGLVKPELILVFTASWLSMHHFNEEE